jgi:hypothetical protein
MPRVESTSYNQTDRRRLAVIAAIVERIEENQKHVLPERAALLASMPLIVWPA